MDKQGLNAPLYHICTNRITHLCKMVKRLLYDQIPLACIFTGALTPTIVSLGTMSSGT